MADKTSLDVLLKLLRIAIGTEEELCLPKDIKWEEVIDLSYSQNVAAIAIDGLQCIYDANPNLVYGLDSPEMEDAKYGWFGISLNTELESAKHHAIVDKLSSIFGDMPFMVMKGLSCAEYYPNPNHRSSGDIDIYPGKYFDKSNKELLASGIPVEMHYYRHSVSYVDDVMIENHRVLGDLRGPRHMMDFEAQLETIAGHCLEGKSGLVHPSADFNALFLPWHVSAHFAFEKVTLRHLLDWALFIRQDANKIDMDLYSEAKKKYTFGFSKFADVLTAMSIKYLNIPEDCLPLRMVSDASNVDSGLCDKILDYMVDATVKERDTNIWKFRWNNVRRVWQDRWKFKEMYGVTVVKFLWYNVMGVLTKKGE